MKIGLIGLNKTGKSTLFGLLTGRVNETPAGTATGSGTARVPDGRVDFLTAIYKPRKTTYAQIEIIDVAGFSPTGAGAAGVSTGVSASAGQKSAAAKFLNDVRGCDALVYVLRAFAAESVPPGSGLIDPAAELQILETELLLADLIMVERRRERLLAGKKAGKEQQEEIAALERCMESLEGGGRMPDLEVLHQHSFLTAKPRLAVVNVDEGQYAARDYPGQQVLAAECAKAGIPLLSLCGAMELEINRLPAADRAMFMEDLGLEQPGITLLAQAAYQLLGYISFFTVGEDEVKAWTIKDGLPAKAAAGKIHTDIERGFIRAEVVRHDDILELGSMARVREKGLYRLEGKSYVIADGDVINFRFNV